MAGGSVQDYKNGDDKTFWGINTFNVSRGSIRLFNFQSDYYKDSTKNRLFNYLTNSGTYSLILAHFFIATRDCRDNSGNLIWFQINSDKTF